MRKVNICIFAKYLPIHVTGGMEIHIRDLVNGLVERGHKVSIITSKHPEGIEKEEEKNQTIYYLKSAAKFTREQYYKESAKKFEEINKQENFNIVHSQSTLGYGYVRVRKKNKPLVVTSHGTAVGEIKTILEGKQRWQSFFGLPFWSKRYLFDEREVFQEADKIIAVSNELKEDIKRQYKIQEAKLITIPNGVDTNKFRPLDKENLKARWGIKNEKIIVSIGKLIMPKGHHLLIKVLSEFLKNTNIKLFIVGTGPYMQNLKEITRKLGVSDKVFFAGEVQHEELASFYNLADVFVFPSLLKEGLPYVILEAMACGVPVIASHTGGIPTAIENYKTGILVGPGNLSELNEKILEVLNDEELARRLGKKARKKVLEEFSLDKMINDTLSVYDAAINEL